jgi:hypothetical protein
MHQTGNLADRQELEQLVWTLGRCLDERDFDGLRQIFTVGATRHDPETASGHDALVDQARHRHSHDQGIQHIITNLITDLGGDQARPIAASSSAAIAACSRYCRQVAKLTMRPSCGR